MKKLIPVVLVILVGFLVGCNPIEIPPEGAILTDKDGVEYLVEPGVGDTYFLKKLPR